MWVGIAIKIKIKESGKSAIITASIKHQTNR